MTLVHVLSTIPAHPRIGRNGCAAPGALQGLRGRLVVLVEVGKLDHQVGSHNGQRQVDLHLRLAWGELYLLGFMPTGWPGE